MTPTPHGAADEPFWAAAAAGKLSFQRCAQCGFVRWPAAGVCPECWSGSADWVEVAGTGTVWSLVVYHRVCAAERIPAVPYNVVLVELDCGVRLLSRLVDVDPAEVRPGDHVVARFVPDPNFGTVPAFTPGGRA